MESLIQIPHLLLARASGADASGDGSTPPPPVPLTPEQLAALPHDDLRANLNVSIWVMIGIAAVFLGLRLYCKISRHSGLWWDDYILIGAFVCITTESAMLSYATTLSYGLHIWDWPYDMDNGIKMLLAINVAGSLSLTSAVWSKTSFALTMIRLTNGYLKAFVWFIIISMNIAMGLSALFNWIQCKPIEKGWNPFLPGTCWPQYIVVNYDIFSAAYSALMDILLALIPWKLIWGLQMKKREKIGVAIAMSCGLFAGITAIIKTTKIPAMLSADPIEGVDLFIWGNAESCVTIVAASIPVLRVLVRDVGSTAKKYYNSNTVQTEGTFTGPGSKLRSGDNTMVSASAGWSVSRTIHGTKMDDNSDSNSILGAHGKILRTSEVAVDYRDRSHDDSTDLEKNH